MSNPEIDRRRDEGCDLAWREIAKAVRRSYTDLLAAAGSFAGPGTSPDQGRDDDQGDRGRDRSSAGHGQGQLAPREDGAATKAGSGMTLGRAPHPEAAM